MSAIGAVAGRWGKEEVVHIQMSRIKLLPASLIAVFAASMVVSAPAYAVEYWELPGPIKMAAGTDIESLLQRVMIETEINTKKTYIECSKNVSTNEVEAAGKSKDLPKFEMCIASWLNSSGGVERENCKAKVPAAEEPSWKDQLVRPGAIAEDEYTTNNPNFLKVEVEGAPCKISPTTLEIKGSYIASLGVEAEVGLGEHETVFTATGSKLKAGTKPVSIIATMAKTKIRGMPNLWYVE
jgi:hypothetical protein